MTKLFTFVATVSFEVEDEDAAYEMLEAWLDYDGGVTLYDIDSWALDPLSGEDVEDEE